MNGSKTPCGVLFTGTPSKRKEFMSNNATRDIKDPRTTNVIKRVTSTGNWMILIGIATILATAIALFSIGSELGPQPGIFISLLVLGAFAAYFLIAGFWLSRSDATPGMVKGICIINILATMLLSAAVRSGSGFLIGLILIAVVVALILSIRCLVGLGAYRRWFEKNSKSASVVRAKIKAERASRTSSTTSDKAVSSLKLRLFAYEKTFHSLYLWLVLLPIVMICMFAIGQFQNSMLLRCDDDFVAEVMQYEDYLECRDRLRSFGTITEYVQLGMNLSILVAIILTVRKLAYPENEMAKIKYERGVRQERQRILDEDGTDSPYEDDI